MALLSVNPVVTGEFVSFYDPSMPVIHVSEAEEMHPDQIGLIPAGQESQYTDDYWYGATSEAVETLARYYDRLSNPQLAFAHIGSCGLRMTLHAVPFPYAVLAVEEGHVVRCIIDDITNDVRYFERHRRERPPAYDDNPVQSKQGVIGSPFSSGDVAVLREKGKKAALILGHI